MKPVKTEFLPVGNGDTVQLDAIPCLSGDDWRQAVRTALGYGQRVCALFAANGSKKGEHDLHVVLADDGQNRLNLGKTVIEGAEYPSLTGDCPQLHLFEREIAEQYGLRPIGHPWLKPLRYHHSWTGLDAWDRKPGQTILPAVGDYFRVKGEQVHEVAVGPVHAGVIEPGHFRFQCNGEQVFHLEIALGYQYRGVEEAMFGGPDRKSMHLMEAVAGDTTIGHATCYCQIVESLSRTRKPVRAQVLSAIALELERIANHVGDLGALSGDVGYLPTASYCGRIRGDFLNLTAFLCGNRFGRGYIRPGRVGYDIDQAQIEEMLRRLQKLKRDVGSAVNLLWDTQSVLARFEDTGRISREFAEQLGIVGPAARATGLLRDVRYNQPSGIFSFVQVPVSTYDSGDVLGRAYVRWMEIQSSIEFIVDQLKALPSGEIQAKAGSLQPDSLSVSVNEAWRGEVCHVAMTDRQGNFSRYKVVDPSFHNWYALAHALRDGEISDFPLCNKSFNLSYCGHDL